MLELLLSETDFKLLLAMECLNNSIWLFTILKAGWDADIPHKNKNKLFPAPNVSTGWPFLHTSKLKCNAICITNGEMV